jgi:diguanylate cyclase (GGDEF)-like protein
VLKSFCRGVQPALGPEDLFGRLGGEEFVALIPLDPGRSATDWAECVRADFSASPFLAGEDRVSATVSIGVATTSECAYDLSALLAAADKALYRAKAKGRNRVEFRSPLTLVPVAG